MKNDIPESDLKIDKEGVWYYRGAEIVRGDIINYFYENLKSDASGRYFIETETDRCYLEVEDTPFLVNAAYKSVTESGVGEGIYILLSDQSIEKLDANTLRVGKDNVLYCSIKNNAFTARFSRASYYQISNFVEYDSERDDYFISLNGTSFYIKCMMLKKE